MTKKNGNQNPEPAPAPDAPRGFEPVVSGHAGWINVALMREAGRRILGTLVGYEPRPDGDGSQFLLKLAEPAIGKRDGEPYELEAGQVVALNETSSLHRMLAPYVHATKNGKPHAPTVCVIVGDLLPLKGGRGEYRDFAVYTEPGVRPGAPPTFTPSPDTQPF